MKKHLLYYVGIALLFLASCQKGTDTKVPAPGTTFSANDAKEWYYGSFKKSGEWQQSPLKGKKLPDWNSARYKKIGEQEIIEFDLSANTTKFKLFTRGDISAADKKRIANAAVSRVLFIKAKSGKILVREIQFIPDMDYAQKKGFDIAENEIGKIQPDFSGIIVSKKWDGTEVARNMLKNGKVKLSMYKTLNHAGSLTESCPIGSTEVTEYARDCESHLYGDGLFTYECGEWYPTGNVFCFGDEEVGGEPNCTENPNSPECSCALTGGCEDPGGDEPPPCSEESADNTLADITTTSTNIKEDIETISETPETITRRYKWKFAGTYNGLGAGYNFYSTEIGIQNKGADQWWRFSSITHEGVSNTTSGQNFLWSAELDQNSTITSTPQITTFSTGGATNTVISIAAMKLDYVIRTKYCCGEIIRDRLDPGTSQNSWYTHEN